MRKQAAPGKQGAYIIDVQGEYRLYYPLPHRYGYFVVIQYYLSTIKDMFRENIS
jgi:hypothetical protein